MPIKTRFIYSEHQLSAEEIAKFSEVQADVVEQLEEEAEMAAEASEDATESTTAEASHDEEKEA